MGTKYDRPMVNSTDREMAILTSWARLQIVGIVKIARNANLNRLKYFDPSDYREANILIQGVSRAR